MRLLSDRDLLRVQLQAYAACGDDDVRQVVREEFAALYALGQARQRAPRTRSIHHFFAEGMLLNVAAALELGGGPEYLVARAPCSKSPPARRARRCRLTIAGRAPFFALVLSDH